MLDTEGLVLMGPGSEWFWSMLQFVIVAASLLGIYYQFRLQRAANAFAQIDAFEHEWYSEALARKRVSGPRWTAGWGAAH